MDIYGLVKQRASELDWMSMDNWPQYSMKDGVIFYTSKDGRDQIVWVVFYNEGDLDIEEYEIYEGVLLELAGKMVGDGCEDFGWTDLDAVIWDIQVGHNFHGLPDDIPNFDLPEKTIYGEINVTWLRIQCVDWAS